MKEHINPSDAMNERRKLGSILVARDSLKSSLQKAQYSQHMRQIVNKKEKKKGIKRMNLQRH